VTSRQHAARQRAVWRAALEKGQQDDSARQSTVWCFVVLSLATRRKGNHDIGFVVAIGKATRNVPNQPPYIVATFHKFSNMRKLRAQSIS
jgi:hypothetical protein